MQPRAHRSHKPGRPVASPDRDARELLISAATELFATRVRYSGLSVGYNVSVAVFGGTTPYVVTLLAARTGNDYAAGIYVVIAAVVSLLTVLTMRETAAKPLVALSLTAPASP